MSEEHEGFALSQFEFDGKPNEAAVQFFIEHIEKGQPIARPVVTKIGDRYKVIDGRARFEAAKRCGVKTVPCYLVELTEPENALELREILNNASREESY